MTASTAELISSNASTSASTTAADESFPHNSLSRSTLPRNACKYWGCSKAAFMPPTAHHANDRKAEVLDKAAVSIR